mgnify:CR=1 FL=1
MAAGDAELVARTRAGETEAFGELVARYRDMVYGLSYHLTGDFEAARDLAQDGARGEVDDLDAGGREGGDLPPVRAPGSPGVSVTVTDREIPVGVGQHQLEGVADVGQSVDVGQGSGNETSG